MSVHAELDGSQTRVQLNYRTDRIERSFASEAAETLESAICYLLNDDGKVAEDAGSESESLLYNAFFKERTGKHASEMEAIWRHRLQGLEASHFPALPHARLRPRLDSATQLVMDGFSVGSKTETQTAALLWTAWAFLVAGCTHVDDIVFGAVVSSHPLGGREHELSPGSKAGSYKRPVTPVRLRIDGHLDIAEMVGQAAAVYDELQQLGRVSRYWIRQLSEECWQACEFQTLVQIRYESDEAGTEDGDVDTQFASGSQQQQHIHDEDFALQLVYHVHHDKLRLELGFDSSVLGKKQSERMASQLETIIRQLIQGPLHGVSGMHAVQRCSQKDLTNIWLWNSAVPEAVDACVHDILAQTTQRRPDAPAICAWDGELTYRELNIHSDTLARYLVSQGCHQSGGTIVPLCFEKSVWTPVAQLAVMKAGAASVVLDSSYPEARLQSIVQQAWANSSSDDGKKKKRIILSSKSNEALSHRLAQGCFSTSSSTGAIVAVAEIIAQQTMQKEVGDQLALPRVRSEDLLYLVFTSGSTGVPKGVMVSHGNMASAVRHHQIPLSFQETSRVFDFASYAFDVAWQSMVLTLAAGGCLCIPSQAQRQDDLVASIKTLGANYLHLTPTVGTLVDYKAVPLVQTLVLGGEMLTAGHLDRCGSVNAVYNSYGPAECTVTATRSVVRDEVEKIADATLSNSNSIGKGCGLVTWIVRLDGTAPAAVGEIGELWLEGPLVGQGYHGDPYRTAQAFVQDPPWLLEGGGQGFPGRTGRLYRTGDLVCYHPDGDGTIRFVGRRDDQVKIRGQRVELGEVETHVARLFSLRGGPDIRLAVEVIQPHESPNPILVAFVVPPSRHPDGLRDAEAVAELTQGLNDELALCVPSSMVPSAYVPIEAIPRTLTGKVDRRQLRQMGQELILAALTETNVVIRKAPSSALESLLVENWADVLGVSPDSISVDIPFTRLGGDSITAMQLVSRLRVHQVRLSVGNVLRHQTVEAIAPRCEMITDSAIQDTTTQDEAEDEAWSLSPIQRFFFSKNNNKVPDHYNHSFLLQPQASYTAEDFRGVLKPLLTRHRMLRARFQYDAEGCWKQHIAPMSPDPISFLAHERVSYADMRSLAQSRQYALDIINGPAFAVDYFQLKDGTINILFTAHHLVIDLVSWRIIWHDIEQLLKGVTLPSSAGTSFRKWTTEQENLCYKVDSELLLPFELTLDSWGVTPSDNTLSAAVDVRTTLDAMTTSLLLDSCNQSLGTEPTDLIVAVLIYSLHKLLPDRPNPPAIFLEAHGREPLDEDASTILSETVGWFTSLCPVQISLLRDDDIAEAVRRVKDVRRRTPGKGLPYFASHHRQGLDGGDSERDIAEFLLNYAGLFQQLEGRGSFFHHVDTDDFLIQASPNARRTALVEINGRVLDGQLRLEISLHRRMRRFDVLRRWAEHGLADDFRSTMQILARLGALPPALSDFPRLLRPSSSPPYEALDGIITRLSSMGYRADAIADLLPCTPLQEGILLGIAKGSASYHIVQIWTCNPPSGNHGQLVDVERLGLAWRLAVGRHSVFRTIFLESAELGSYVQVELKKTPPTRISQLQLQPEIDCCPASALSRAAKPVFSDDQPHYAISICRSANGKVACRIDVSHTLIDATSLQVLLADVAKAYRQRTAVPEAPAFSLAVEEVTRVPPAGKLQYWREYLTGAEPCRVPTLELDTTEDESRQMSIRLASRVVERIDSFCRSQDITRSTLLQVSWAMVLSLLTGKADVCFAYLASGRDVPIQGIDEMVGPLINTLVSRVELRSYAGRVLAETGRHLINHFDYQHVSLAKIQAEIGLQGEQLFNTGLTVRQSFDLGRDDQLLSFEDAFGEDPNEVRRENPNPTPFYLLHNVL